MMEGHAGEQCVSPAPGQLALRLFGPMEVEVGGRSLPRLRSRKGKFLLAILTLRAGRDVDREWLAGTLWPDDDVAAARHSLRQSVSDLRSALGSEAWRLSSDAPGSLRLNLDGGWADALVFDALMARGDTASLDAAVQLYRGPLLEDCPVDWVLEARGAREEAYLKALQTLAAAASARGDSVSSAGYLRRAAESQPFDETAHRALMKALCQAGDAPEAVVVYRKFRERLWREMSIAPSEATTALYRRILYGRREPAKRPAQPGAPAPSDGPASSSSARQASSPPAKPAPRPRPLPVPLTDLIGRENDARQVRAWLEKRRLVTLTGAGGIGKTSLALQVAADLQPDFDGGSAFVDLVAITDAAVVPDSVRQALGLPESADGREVEEILTDYLRSREVFLVLDNCEHLVAACASLVDRLLSHCPGLRILATSRHALGLRGEAVFRVPSLALPPAGADRMRQRPGRPGAGDSTFPAIQLFIERARASGVSFDLNPRTMESVVAICRRLDGIPLAIELAAARVRSLPVGEVNCRLQKDFSLLQGGEAWGIERHRTLCAVFDWSWNLLSHAERATLAALSVFSGGWSLDAAQAVCAGDAPPSTVLRPPSSIHPDEVLDLLTSLVDKSLVIYQPPFESDEPGDGAADLKADQTGRYRLLETVRQFAEQKLTDAGQRDAVIRRHCDFYLSWAEEHHQSLWGTNAAFWFDQFEIEHDNLRAAIEGLRAQGEIEKEIRLLIGLSRFWDTHGHLREGRRRLESGIARITPEVPPTLGTTVVGVAGWAALAQADYAAARSHYLQALALDRAEEDSVGVARNLNFLACIAKREGRLEEARVQFEESLLLAREFAGPGTLASVLNNLGDLEIMTGDLKAAEVRLTEAASLCKETGQSQLLGIINCNLAVTAFRLERPHEAKDYCAAGIRSLRDAGALVNLPSALGLMGAARGGLGAPERTAQLLGAAAALFEALGLPPSQSGEPEIGQAAAAARETLGAVEFEKLYLEGQTWSLEQAIEFALSDD